MDITPRLESLQHRHEALEVAIHAEEAHPYHNEQKIHALKLEKLHLKEEIFQLTQAANSNRAKKRH
ncbi:MAG: YdcH family protein [Bdellovibrionales bacterium]